MPHPDPNPYHRLLLVAPKHVATLWHIAAYQSRTCSDVALHVGALGTLERKAHNLDMALSYLEKALELTPRHQAACVEMAIVLRKLGREEQAVKFSDKAIKERTARKYKHSHVKQDGQVKHANEFVRSSELQQVN